MTSVQEQEAPHSMSDIDQCPSQAKSTVVISLQCSVIAGKVIGLRLIGLPDIFRLMAVYRDQSHRVSHTYTCTTQPDTLQFSIIFGNALCYCIQLGLQEQLWGDVLC